MAEHGASHQYSSICEIIGQPHVPQPNVKGGKVKENKHLAVKTTRDYIMASENASTQHGWV
jgi:hypothetical protein